MNYLRELLNLKERLATKAKVDAFALQEGLGDKAFAFFEKTIGFVIPGIVKEFYRQVNGVQLRWGLGSDAAVTGYINIVPLEECLFGYPHAKADAQHPFKDILWNEHMPADVIQELKQHYLLEVFEGSSASTTLKFTQGQVQVFDLYIDDLNAYAAGFESYLQQLFFWGGLEGCREQLIKTGHPQSTAFNDHARAFLSAT